MTKPFLQIERLSRRYPARGAASEVVVFEDLSIDVERGQFVTLIGHSGCGKSTLLSIVAGLDTQSSGYVFVNGKQVTGPGLSRGVVFQNHNLLPWLSALDNVAFAVRARHPGFSRERAREHARTFLAKVGLSGAEERRPAELSGGMRQRVGIARAFAIEPQILLLDEPFGALDALSRASLQDQLLELWSQTGQTVLMITHDVDEALYLSDRVLVMSDGPRARVEADAGVAFARPRERVELARQEPYHALKTRLMGLLTRGSPSLPAAPAPPRSIEITPLSHEALSSSGE
ncbi:MAG: ABC transporter ATP-binding protein [Polyangiaceae bacterium]